MRSFLNRGPLLEGVAAGCRLHTCLQFLHLAIGDLRSCWMIRLRLIINLLDLFWKSIHGHPLQLLCYQQSSPCLPSISA
ncbi:hypothetical protein ATANTOWER_020239 [Ataeniobius toweri]|uniref:Uncharacterized protein n=1 Tax=Ataeniobius toweri TaxID=208326 RepID=A0ABU7BSL9_9TELE|nr:hypothetical protein [Ataeniobius toweri]